MKRIITLGLGLLFAASCFACGGKTDAKQPESLVDSVNDYETVVQFDTMRVDGHLGKIETNVDMEFVTSGKQSAKITVDSQPVYNMSPSIFQSLTQEKSGDFFDDFSFAKSLEVDVYSAQQSERTLGIELIYTGGGTMTKYFTLQPGWNDVVFEIKREYLPEYENPETLEKSLAVRGLNFKFERGETDEVFYFDNLRKVRTKKGFNPISMQLDRDEIASFDKEWQVELARVTGFYVDRLSARLSTGTEDGRTFIRCICPAGDEGGQFSGQWGLNDEQVSLVPWSSYRPQSRLVFDYYVPETDGMTKFLFLVGTDAYNEAADSWYETSLGEYELRDIVPGTWHTFSITMEQINNYYLAQSLGKTYKDITHISFWWLEFGGNPREFRIDNMRMIY